MSTTHSRQDPGTDSAEHDIEAVWAATRWRISGTPVISARKRPHAGTHRYPGGPVRVLVTGSATWTDTATIRTALAQVWHPHTHLITTTHLHGVHPRGAVALCARCWKAWGGPVRHHPHPRPDPCALGVAVCLAFLHPHEPDHTATRAEQAGITTRRYTHPATPGAHP